MDEGPLASQFRRRVVMIMLAGYTAFVLVITLSPRMPGSGFVARLVDRVLASLHARGLFEFVDFLVAEFFGNILMFIPLGVFVALIGSLLTAVPLSPAGLGIVEAGLVGVLHLGTLV